MNKEIKVSDVFNIPFNGACVHVNFNKLKDESNDGATPFDLIGTALNDHDRLTNESAALREQLESLFERVSGCEVSEFPSEQVNYLADMIEGQMDANEGCIDNLKSENAALREALRLKKLECEALAHDKSVALEFVKRVSETPVETYTSGENEDGDFDCFEHIEDIDLVFDAQELLEDISNADKGGKR